MRRRQLDIFFKAGLSSNDQTNSAGSPPSNVSGNTITVGPLLALVAVVPEVILGGDGCTGPLLLLQIMDAASIKDAAPAVIPSIQAHLSLDLDE